MKCSFWNFKFVFDSGSKIENEGNEENKEQNNEISAKTIPNFAQVFNAIEHVRFYLIKLDLNDGTINMNDKIEKSIIYSRAPTSKQTHITDFFNEIV